MSYSRKLKGLIEDCKLKGINVKFVGKTKLADYGGMNHKAADAMGIKGYKKNEIWLPLGASEEYKYKTLQHEIAELDRMKRGDTYWEAHTELIEKEDN
jgi:hypothetical protein